MQRHGCKFIRESIPNKIVQEGNKKKVSWMHEGVEVSDTFDTVMLAIGRSSDTKKIGLEELGIKTKPNGKIICNDDDV